MIFLKAQQGILSAGAYQNFAVKQRGRNCRQCHQKMLVIFFHATYLNTYDITADKYNPTVAGG
jgi:hypothetical protein